MLFRQKVVYCGPCGMPLEYCEYSPDFESHCRPWVLKSYPALFQEMGWGDDGDGDGKGAATTDKPSRPSEPWTLQERLTAFYEKYEPTKVDNVPQLLEKYEGKEEKLFQALVKKYGPEPEDPYYLEDDEDDDGKEVADDDDDEEGDPEDAAAAATESSKSKKKRRGVGAKKTAKVDTRVVIQKISRNRKKATTVVVGMDTVPGIKLKDVSKAFSKRFAGSSSVKDGTKGGGKEIIIQGDHMDDVAEMIVHKFHVPGNSVYMDIDGEFVPYE